MIPETMVETMLAIFALAATLLVVVSLPMCCTKKKKSRKTVGSPTKTLSAPLLPAPGNPSADTQSPETPAPATPATPVDTLDKSKQCNLKSGLNSDDPDLKSSSDHKRFNSKNTDEKEDHTDLRSIPDESSESRRRRLERMAKGGTKEDRLSMYIGPNDGVSVLAMNVGEADRAKLPAKMQKQQEKTVEPQEKTQSCSEKVKPKPTASPKKQPPKKSPTPKNPSNTRTSDSKQSNAEKTQSEKFSSIHSVITKTSKTPIKDYAKSPKKDHLKSTNNPFKSYDGSKYC
ncbi:hypothetical protein L596_015399 [Steinernema carpocapsae]|uniref:Uncharacterized protein n=1 Tax=Steinernema carpocapsae TaxID=34508 RepID=A0A4U5NFR0_STECR|nr:hypothetical protein L596_015399 [Steinernema carpocapsae]